MWRPPFVEKIYEGCFPPTTKYTQVLIYLGGGQSAKLFRDVKPLRGLDFEATDPEIGNFDCSHYRTEVPVHTHDGLVTYAKDRQ